MEFKLNVLLLIDVQEDMCEGYMAALTKRTNFKRDIKNM